MNEMNYTESLQVCEAELFRFSYTERVQQKTYLQTCSAAV
jgi:hypothetical protein